MVSIATIMVLKFSEKLKSLGHSNVEVFEEKNVVKAVYKDKEFSYYYIDDMRVPLIICGKEGLREEKYFVFGIYDNYYVISNYKLFNLTLRFDYGKVINEDKNRYIEYTYYELKGLCKKI